ncbi:hypothetical protein GCM10010954_33160 [Halobacillus andaensis]|uniref:Flagellar protein FliT n=1 Tax=Halobacillus andaensis TaxID=1176239 RepID=A0A917EY53_HALAA|nr:flagellar protein FliT [Halobacillus andaensis]MBP2005420.1 flagellar protein FliT [Halobacillus andaensis]GGF31335.1 hypothetical protein GCM10010954_33160 [Halobacillus andaensis]
MSSWSVFLQHTEELSQQVHQRVTDDNRARVIQNVQRLLAVRSELLPELSQPEDEEEKARVERVKSLDKDIQQMLDLLFGGLKREMRNVKRQKSSNQKYTNPYQSLSAYDGMFMDRKK